ncbi:hypothetical protein [Actinocrispum wychmicini]|uniref:Uncharacterized protein n=1 Tax=Actinocrispum wychmicini TaxID=1213861 RepID=A0A4R2JKP9_9PSEU|nr:hypothetical protein [Actinocrispum wychmicini]TCO57149.1 hypothetical protein EV192_106626 [Actinocrispum wychmicini]
MTTPDDREAIEALLPEDRTWLTAQGWRDTSNDYPEIGTERTLE